MPVVVGSESLGPAWRERLRRGPGRVLRENEIVNRQLALETIAEAILDGTPVDWRVVGSNVETGTAADEGLMKQRTTLEALRLRRTRDPRVPSGGAGGRPAGNGWFCGHLLVLERVGQGACGEVYRAWD